MFRDLPPRGWARVSGVLSRIAAAVAAGSTIGFLAIVFAGVVAEEAFTGFWREGAWDAILRAAVGVAGLALGIALGVWAVLHGLSRLADIRELADRAERDPDIIATWDRRRHATSKDPFSGFVGFAIIFLVIGAIALLGAFLAVADGIGDDAASALEALVILAVVVAPIALVVLGLVLRAKVWLPRWRRAVERMDVTWTTRRIQTAAAEERARRPRREDLQLPVLSTLAKGIARIGTRISTIAAGIAGVTFLIGLFARQPCRRCDPVQHGDFGEWAIDALMRIAGPVAVVAVLLVGLALVSGWVAHVIEFRALRRLADAGHGTPGGEVLDRVLPATWPGTTAGSALVAIGWGLAPILLAAHGIAPETVPVRVPAAFAALGVVGVAVLAWASSASARSRNRLRAAWSPGDVRLPPGAAGRGRPRRRPVRRGTEAVGR